VKHKLLASRPHGRAYFLAFDVDDDVLEALQQFCELHRVYAATFSAIGGFRRATLAYYDMDEKRYEPIAVDEQVEAVSLLGNVALYGGKPRIHAHALVAHRDGHTSGGHLLGAIVRPTLELLLEELPASLHRTDRPQIGIPLIDL